MDDMEKKGRSSSFGRTVGFKSIAVMAAAFCLLCGCDVPNGKSPVSVTDVSVSSEPQAPIGPYDAVSVYVGEVQIEDMMVMSYDWDGEQYENENSLNQLMLVKYMSPDSVIPQAPDGALLTIRFADGVTMESMSLMQMGNTFKANTGIPYDIQTIDIVQDEEGYDGFVVNYGKFTMYYYLLSCTLSNGNTVQYAFALERSA